MPADKTGTVVLYAAAAAVAAITLVYVFGPSLFPEDESNKNISRGGAVGLVNLANDCFMNSVLQALAGSKELKLFLAEEAGARPTVDGEKNLEPSQQDASGKLDPRSLNQKDALAYGTVTRALNEIIDALFTTSGYRRSISAKSFIGTLEYAFDRVINRRQQDAQEFLQIVLERLSDEYQTRMMTTGPTKNGDLQRNILFHGRTTSQIECSNCHFKPPPIVTAFSMLSLNVPHASSTTLDTCLDGLLKLETIEDYKCLRCTADAILSKQGGQSKTEDAHTPLPLDHSSSTHGDALLQLDEEALEAICRQGTDTGPVKRRISRHTYISNFPRLLILHLSRSLFDVSALSSKNDAKVAFPEMLTLGSFDPRKFRLASLITHRGGHDSGHYETFRRQGKLNAGATDAELGERAKRSGRNKWWRISDDRVAECKTQDVLNMQKEAYLLFYEAVES